MLNLYGVNRRPSRASELRVALAILLPIFLGCTAWSSAGGSAGGSAGEDIVGNARSESPTDFDSHWSFKPPVWPEPASVSLRSWPRGPIDAYLLQDWERMAESAATKPAFRPHPAPEATPTELLRRASFTLTGLPPEAQEVREFLADETPDAYDRWIDRLLASPGYGERLATHWLDVARYADTHGYHADTQRDMWRWRDWVIDAWNQDLAFERFTIEQLAGDLLPNATLEQRLASGFNRNHMINFENGAIAEEYRCEYVADRVVTTATVWLGLTVQCARCHDHKHDPISQTDFYQLFAFFNNVPENGLDGQRGNADPVMSSPTRAQQYRIAALRDQILQFDKQYLDSLQRRPSNDPLQLTWERAILKGAKLHSTLADDTSLHLSMDQLVDGRLLDTHSQPHVRGSVTAGTELTRGKSGAALLLDGQARVTVQEFPVWHSTDPMTLSLTIFPTTLDDCTLLARLNSQRNDQGLQISISDQHVEVRLIQDGNVVTTLAVRTKDTLAANRWQNLTVTLDGTDRAPGIQCFIDGHSCEMETTESTYIGPILISEPLQIGGREGSDGLRGMLDDVRIYHRRLSLDEIAIFSGRDPLLETVAVADASRSVEQQRQVRKAYLEATDAVFHKALRERQSAERELAELHRSAPTTMVMDELPQRRETFVLERGMYDSPGSPVQPALPTLFGPQATVRTRLELAKWLASRNNPLGARVMANRLWQLHWDRALVTTGDDFGSRGDRPSHPEVLDWLACQLLDSNRDSAGSMKRLQRLIVLSSSFRQSSNISREQLEFDRENRQCARGPRHRLSAEMIRDQALAASGHLVRVLGGPSVFPYQPAGLWEEVAYDTKSFSAQTYVQSHGADLVRRGLYTFWKRAVPPSALAVWDAPDREVCTVSRPQTNTPLQALAIWNDPTIVESARWMAHQIMATRLELRRDESNIQGSEWWLEEAFLRVTSRLPETEEMRVLQHLFTSQQRRWTRQSALDYLRVGETTMEPSDDYSAEDLAALASVIDMLFSTDEALYR